MIDLDAEVHVLGVLMSGRGGRIQTWFLAALLVGSPLAAGDAYLRLGVGAGPFRHWAPKAYGSLEYGQARIWGPLGGWVSLDLEEHQRFLGLGPSLSFPIGADWEVAVGSGPGWYSGRGDVLGYPLEFRSTLAVSRSLGTRSRIGASVSHYSNASLARVNPGAETVRVFLQLKL